MPRQILVLLMIYLFRESSLSLLQQTSPSTSSFKSSAGSKWWELFKNSCPSVEPCSSELGQIDKAFWSIVGKHFFGGLDSIKTIKSISSTIQFAKFISRLKVRNILIPKKADENGEKWVQCQRRTDFWRMNVNDILTCHCHQYPISLCNVKMWASTFVTLVDQIL